LTAILCAKAEPWRAWGAHLAGFGAQAALVADSPYYKLLIGRMLGYREEHIRHHIQVGCHTALLVLILEGACKHVKQIQPPGPCPPTGDTACADSFAFGLFVCCASKQSCHMPLCVAGITFSVW
jgi:hypothetical protein